MLEFIRTFRPILPRAFKQRLVLSAVGALFLAGLEAIGVVLVFPLVQTLDAVDGKAVPSSAEWLTDVIGSREPGTIALALAGMVFLAFIVKGVLAVLYLRWNFRLLANAEADTSARLLRAYLHAPWTFHLDRNTSEMTQHVHLSMLFAFQLGLANMISALADLAVIVVVALVLVAVDPWVALLAVGYMTLVAFLYRSLIVKRSSDASFRRHLFQTEAFRGTQQSLGAAKEVAVTRRQEFFVAGVRDTKRRMAHNEATLLLLGQLPRYYLEVALLVGVGVLSAVLFPLRSTSDAVAMLAVFLAAGFRLLPSLHRILSTVSSVRQALPPLRSISGDLTLLEPSLPDDEVEGQAPATLPAGPIRFEDVTFSYERGDLPVLRDLSFTIEPAASVAFVGASGVGKTTLIDLLLGLLQPSSGRVTVGGQPIDGMIHAWQRSIGYVPQEVGLIDDTILANIAFGLPPEEVDEEQLQAAVRLAQLEQFIDELPEGLATVAGEDGVRISGGQRQRVGIARALYHRPSTLVLDEATSSLDSNTESLITKTVESLHGEMTIVTVSHRLSTVRNHDRVFFMKGGGVDAEGSFDELLAASADFKNLATLADVT